jgi:hypothetical protein
MLSIDEVAAGAGDAVPFESMEVAADSGGGVADFLEARTSKSKLVVLKRCGRNESLHL